MGMGLDLVEESEDLGNRHVPEGLFFLAPHQLRDYRLDGQGEGLQVSRVPQGLKVGVRASRGEVAPGPFGIVAQQDGQLLSHLQLHFRGGRASFIDDVILVVEHGRQVAHDAGEEQIGTHVPQVPGRKPGV